MLSNIKLWKISSSLLILFTVFSGCNSDIKPIPIGKKSDGLAMNKFVSKDELSEKDFHWNEETECYFRINPIPIKKESFLETTYLYLNNDKIDSLICIYTNERKQERYIKDWVLENLFIKSATKTNIDTNLFLSYKIKWLSP